jgi:hypothetical protein
MMRPLALVLAIVALTACGGGSDSDATEAPTVDPNARYGSVDDLVEAVRLAGGDCPHPHPPVYIRIAAESRFCRKGFGVGMLQISTYVTDANLEKAVREGRGFAHLDAKYDIPITSLLVGPNWIIEGPLEQVEALQLTLGGTVMDMENLVGQTGPTD